MRFVLFYHSLVSDWNHGNAHFLRGIVAELLARGHEVTVFEPQDGWSVENLRKDQGPAALDEFAAKFPHLRSTGYQLDTLDLERELADAEVVLVHEWNDRQLVRRLGELKARGGTFKLLFHDTHHRSFTAPAEMAAYDLSDYDGVLAYGRPIRDRYLAAGWARAAWVWHEAADTRVFWPRPATERVGDLVWIGNWGDEERTHELEQYLLQPVQALALRACVHGVRYPAEGRAALEAAGIECAGWLPNYHVPDRFAQFATTVHIPRRPYRHLLPGIPTIRLFEALACGIPLVSLAWDDIDGLFQPDRDYLVARTPRQMREQLRTVLNTPALASALAEQGRATILRHHSCAHRVDELLEICHSLGIAASPAAATLSDAANTALTPPVTFDKKA